MVALSTFRMLATSDRQTILAIRDEQLSNSSANRKDQWNIQFFFLVFGWLFIFSSTAGTSMNYEIGSQEHTEAMKWWYRW